MIRIAISDSGLRRLVLQALRGRGLDFFDAESAGLPPADDVHFWHTPDGSGVLLIHDFPEGGIEAFRRMAREISGLKVFAVVRPPVIVEFWKPPIAEEAVLGFTVVSLGDPMPVRELGRALQKAHSRMPGSDLLRLLREHFDPDSTLDRALTRLVHAGNPIRTVARLRRELDLSERKLTASVRRAGFASPGEFLALVRCLLALDLIRHGYTVEQAAEIVGYGTVATLGRHSGQLFDATPAVAARRWSSDELLECFAKGA